MSDTPDELKRDSYERLEAELAAAKEEISILWERKTDAKEITQRFMERRADYISTIRELEKKVEFLNGLNTVRCMEITRLNNDVTRLTDELLRANMRIKELEKLV